MQDNTWEQFYKLYLPMEQILFRIVYQIVKEKHSAQEVIQNVAAIGILKFGQLQRKENFHIWITGIAIEEAHSRQNTQKAGETANRVANRLEHNESSDGTTILLKRAVQQLASIDQQIIYLRFHLDMEYAQIAELTNLTPDAVKKRLKLASVRLRGRLEEKI